MVTSTSRLAYGDCFELMDKAIADQRGIKIKCATEGDARHLRTRLHSARRIDRDENAKTYPDGHPMYGRSVYDVLGMRLRPQKEWCWLAIEKWDARQFEIESLSEQEEEQLPLIAPIPGSHKEEVRLKDPPGPHLLVPITVKAKRRF